MPILPYDPNDVDVMARTLYGEARGEPPAGMAAVAWVIRNRAEDGRWPRSVAAVCRQPWQFSCWNKNDPNRHWLETVSLDMSRLFQLCHGVALCVLNDLIPDPTSKACHYLNPKVASPKWAEGRQPCYGVGRHVFFNDVP